MSETPLASVFNTSFVRGARGPAHHDDGMWGLLCAVAMMRGVAGPYIMPAALSPSNEVKVPLAPEKGLFLERCIFDAYNARWSSEHGEGVDLAQYQEQIAAFKVPQSTCYHSGDCDGQVGRWHVL